MPKKYKNSISLMLMIVITCVTQVFALMKSSIVAGHFGTSLEMDAYYFANSIVNFISGLFAAAIPTVVIPSYVKKNNREAVDSFLTFVFGVMGCLVIVLGLFRYPFVNAITNRSELYTQLAGDSLLMLLAANYFFSVTYITTAHFQTIGKYNIPKIIKLFAQVFIVGALFLFRDISITQYVLILAIELVLNTIVDSIIALKYGWRFKPSFKFRSQETVVLFKLFVPMLLSAGVDRLSITIDSVIASGLDVGQLSVLSYATQIINIVNTILIGNLLIYIYPKIVKRIQQSDSQKLFWEQTSFFHLIVCLIVAGYAVVGHEGIALLFQHGKFKATATDIVFLCSLIYVAGQMITIVRDLLYRYFYAIGDTKTTAANSIMVSVVNIAISVVLVNFIGIYGIILGTVLSQVVSMVRMFMKFHSEVGFEVSIPKLALSFLLNIVIASATVGIVLLTKWVLPIQLDLVRIIVFGLETVAVFVGLTFAVKRNILSVIKTL